MSHLAFLQNLGDKGTMIWLKWTLNWEFKNSGFCYKLTSFISASHFSKHLISSIKGDNNLLIPHRVTLAIELDNGCISILWCEKCFAIKMSTVICICHGFTSEEVTHNGMVSPYIKVLEAQC